MAKEDLHALCVICPPPSPDVLFIVLALLLYCTEYLYFFLLRKVTLSVMKGFHK